MTVPEALKRVERQGTGRSLTPRDAATLIVVDATTKPERILMGRRRSDLAFMPGKYVFPGGRVDPEDGRAMALDDLPEALESRLLNSMRGRPSRRRARALALAAIRETFEEAGLLLGKRRESSAQESHGMSWRAFGDHGVVPALSPLRLVARAITPPGRPRRFDTRFFTADASAIAGRLPTESAPDGELEDLAWPTIDEAQTLDLPRITHVVLDSLKAGLVRPSAYGDHPSVPFFHMRHGRFVMDMI